MKIYDWHCEKCGRIKEDIDAKFVAVQCPCGEMMKKKPARPGLVRVK